jgi:hypothetical protein
MISTPEINDVADAVSLMRRAGIKTSPNKVKAGIEQGVYRWGEFIQLDRSPSYTVYNKPFFKWLNEMTDQDLN